MLRVAYAVLLALMPPSSALSAQSVCPDSPPPYGLLRQDEDYRYLSNPTCRQDFWDHLKYVPLGSNQNWFITVGGEVREWYEGFRNASWGLGTQDDNGYLLQRLTTHADIHAAPRIRFFVQLTSDIEAGRNGGPRPVIDESKLFFEEGFVDVVLSKAGRQSLVLRLGRHPMFVKLSTAPLWNGRRPHGLSMGLLQSPCSTVPASLMRPRIMARRFGESMRFIR